MEKVQGPNFNILTKAHENKWVAISSDQQKVVATAETLHELRKRAGEQDVIVMRVLPRQFGYAPNAQG